MSISVTLLICIFVLCCTGSIRTFAARLCVQPGWIAAWSLLAAALSACTFPLAKNCACNAAALLCIVSCFLLCRRDCETQITMLLAFLCGILSWFLHRLVPKFFEPALLMALPTVLLSLPLPLKPRQKLLCQALSPIFFGLVATLEEWYLFDIAVFSIGSAIQLDMQIFGLVLFICAYSVRFPKTKKSFDTQKEY